MDYELIRNFLIALFIGALVGLEREKKKMRDGESIGGIRTFLLISEAGALCAWLSVTLHSAWIFIAGLLGVALLAFAGFIVQAKVSIKTIGMTTEIAALVVFLLGGVTLFGHPEIAVALGIATSVALAYKQPLHGLVEKVGTEDLYAALKLLVATFIVLPVLPNRPLDPWGALNPYSLWWLVILISGLSLVGYVAVRLLGSHRGTLLTGLAGGLASSTAVTLSLAKRSRERGAPSGASLASAMFLAWSVMFLRVLIEVAVVYSPLVKILFWPFCAMAGVAAILALLAYRKAAAKSKEEKTEEVALKNPFSLTSAIRFALLFAVVLVAVKVALRYLPEESIYAVAALAGLTDVDAITLSMAQEARSGATAIAGPAITLAAFANTLSKAGMVVALGAGPIRKHVLLGAVAIIVAGALAFLPALA